MIQDQMEHDNDVVDSSLNLPVGFCGLTLNSPIVLLSGCVGFAAGSMALKADSLDFLGDTATYAISLAVIGMPLRRRAPCPPCPCLPAPWRPPCIRPSQAGRDPGLARPRVA